MDILHFVKKTMFTRLRAPSPSLHGRQDPFSNGPRLATLGHDYLEISVTFRTFSKNAHQEAHGLKLGIAPFHCEFPSRF